MVDGNKKIKVIKYLEIDKLKEELEKFLWKEN
jgi:hypothetical protein